MARGRRNRERARQIRQAAVHQATLHLYRNEWDDFLRRLDDLDDINAKDREGRTVLHVAASLGRLEAIRHLISDDRKVDLDIRDDENGWTALHRAFYFGNVECALALLSAGASSYGMTDKDGYLPLDLVTLDAYPQRQDSSGMKSKRRQRSSSGTITEDAESAQTSEGEDDEEEAEADQDDDRQDSFLPFPAASSLGRGASALDTDQGHGDEEGVFGELDSSVFSLLRRQQKRLRQMSAQKSDDPFSQQSAEGADQEFLGQAYSWGSNSTFAIGHADGDSRKRPQHVPVNAGGVVEVSTAKFHTLFRTETGCVYACGHGQGGRLGCTMPGAKSATCVRPTRVNLPVSPGVSCVSVAAGRDHSLFVMSNGTLYATGSNEFGQLGLGKDVPWTSTPKLVKAFKGQHCLLAAASNVHSAILTTDGVYTFGRHLGQLGHTLHRARGVQEDDIIATPKRAVLSHRPSTIRRVFASELTTACLLVSGDLVTITNNAIQKHVCPQTRFPADQHVHYLKPDKFRWVSLSKHGIVVTASQAGLIYVMIPGSSRPSFYPITWDCRHSIVAKSVTMGVQSPDQVVLHVTTLSGDVVRGCTTLKRIQQRVPVVPEAVPQMFDARSVYCDVGAHHFFVIRRAYPKKPLDTQAFQSTPASSEAEDEGLPEELTHVLRTGVVKIDPPSLQADLARLFDDSQANVDTHCDLVLTAELDHKRVQAHRALLSARCPGFAQLLNRSSDRNTVSVPSVTGIVLSFIARYLYCGDGGLPVVNERENPTPDEDNESVVHMRHLLDAANAIGSVAILQHFAAESTYARTLLKRSGVSTGHKPLGLHLAPPPTEELAKGPQHCERKDLQYADTVLVCEQDEKGTSITADEHRYVPCHSFLLAARSIYFRARFDARWNESGIAPSQAAVSAFGATFSQVRLPKEATPKCARAVVDFIYSDVVKDLSSFTLDELFSLMATASYLLLDRLSETAQREIQRHIIVQNVVEISEKAVHFCAHQLLVATAHFVCRNLQMMVCLKIVSHLPQELLALVDEIYQASIPHRELAISELESTADASFGSAATGAVGGEMGSASAHSYASNVDPLLVPHVQNLVAMGFEHDAALEALKRTGVTPTGLQRAVQILVGASEGEKVATADSLAESFGLAATPSSTTSPRKGARHGKMIGDSFVADPSEASGAGSAKKSKRKKKKRGAFVPPPFTALASQSSLQSLPKSAAEAEPETNNVTERSLSADVAKGTAATAELQSRAQSDPSARSPKSIPTETATSKEQAKSKPQHHQQQPAAAPTSAKPKKKSQKQRKQELRELKEKQHQQQQHYQHQHQDQQPEHQSATKQGVWGTSSAAQAPSSSRAATKSFAELQQEQLREASASKGPTPASAPSPIGRGRTSSNPWAAVATLSQSPQSPMPAAVARSPSFSSSGWPAPALQASPSTSDQPTAAASVDMLSTSPKISFAMILEEERRNRQRITREITKPMRSIQIEDQAIADLLAHYKAANNPDERISVRRVQPGNESTP